MSVETRPFKGGHSIRYLLGGEEVSRLQVLDLRMHIGRALLRAGGISNVRTDEAYRRRGFARLLIERAVALMRAEGYELSTLFGISDFYPRWGYAPIFGETRLLVATRDAGRAQHPYALRRLSRDECLETLELYRRNNALRSGAVARRPPTWQGFTRASRGKGEANVYGAFDDRGRLMGYAVLERSSTEALIAELGYRDRAAFGSLLHAGVRQARRAQAEHVQVLLPADHPFVEYCRQFGCQVVTHYRRAGGAMGRIIVLQACFTTLPPELTRRLALSPTDWAGRLLISTDIGEVALRIHRGEITCEDSPHAEAADARLDITEPLLTQLLFGYRSVEDALNAGASLRGCPLEVAAALFPRGCAHVWHPDRF